MQTRPLLEENATELEKVLLRAGRNEEPDRLASSRLLGVLQGLPPLPGPMGSGPGPIPASLGGGLAATAAAKSATLATWVKIGALALGVGGAGVATHRLVRPHPTAPLVQATSHGRPALAPRPAPPAVPANEHTMARAPEPTPAEGNPRMRKVAPGPRPREAVREPLPEATPPPQERSLADETSALDRARDSLEAHRFAEALRLLGEYHKQFPKGRMQPEATVLRLTALVKSGQHEAAQSLADRLLADDTYKTYAPRIRSLLRELKR